MGDYYSDRERAQDIKARFEQQKQYSLPLNTAVHTHGKEYHFTLSWNADGQKFINNKLDFHNGKLYFFNRGYLFRSNEDGSELEVLLKVGTYFSTDLSVSVDASNVFLAVNATGIYLYQHGSKLNMLWFDLTGTFLKKVSISGNISQVYVAGSRIYYARTRTHQQICCYDCATQEDVVLMEASKVLELYGDAEKAVFRVVFETVDGETAIYDEGWYLYRFATQETACLSSANCPPHYVFTNPECYKPGNSQYIDFKDELKIRAVDLVRNLMWVATSLREKLENGTTSQEYWEPFTLEAGGKPIPDAPIWRLTSSQFTAGAKSNQLIGASYFDGTCFLIGRSIYYMKSFDLEGNMTCYGTQNQRGACHNFRVLNGYVYADFEAKGWEQYALEDGNLTFVRLCGFGANAEVSSQTRSLIMNFTG